jgi:hypothetical protein
MRTNTIAAVSIITAIIVSSNYVLLGFPQIKLMDSMVFLTGYLFGVKAAISVSILSWLVYGSINPLGAAGFPLIVFLMIGEMVYGIAGFIFRKYYNMPLKFKNNPMEIVIMLGCTSIICTFVYDMWTNAIEGLIIFQNIDGIILRIITGIPFSIIHQLANIAIFCFLVPIFIYMLTNLKTEIDLEE